MQPDNSFDIIVVGAGPAGLCATLRLLELGYKVGLIEQEIFPREQIGESLSPGVRNIFSYLKVDHLLENPNYLNGLPAEVIWENAQPLYLERTAQAGGIVLNRSLLDSELLKIAVERGATVFQPAKLESSVYKDARWQLNIKHESKAIQLSANVVMDARGRKGIPASQRFQLAPATVALWTHLPAELMPQKTLIEATQDGWIWGSMLPFGQYRIMAFVDSQSLKKNSMQVVFQDILQESQLFSSALKLLPLEDLQACSVLSYVHVKPWNNQYLRIGDAAFALDPLSSTGVEKAMRFALQAVVAVNTLLKSNKKLLAQSFYEEKLIESVVTHTRWTREYYKNSFQYSANKFWKDRAYVFQNNPKPLSHFLNCLQEKLSENTVPSSKTTRPGIDVPALLQNLWHSEVLLSPDVAFNETPCIINDCIEMKMAVQHPGLEREIVYLQEIELKPLLDLIHPKLTVGELVYTWEQHIAPELARKFAAYLLDIELIKTV